MKLAALFVTLSVTSMAQNYTARTAPQQGIPVVHLVDTAKGVEVSVVPSLGNRVTEIQDRGVVPPLLAMCFSYFPSFFV